MNTSPASSTEIAPQVPPRSCSIAPLGARIGPDPVHFVVEEVPAYPLSGSGEHLFLWIEKTGLNTTDVAKRLAHATNTKERDIGYAGMKDRHAVTRQWFSVLSKQDDVQKLDLGEGIRILQTTRHNNKLRTGHLIGNRFWITLINATAEDQKLAQQITAFLENSGMHNYYGAQRFGHRGKNLKLALQWLNSQASDTNFHSEQTELMSNPRRRGGKKPSRFDNKLHPSVIQSEFFNRYLRARTELAQPLLKGEVVRLQGTGTHFVVEDLEKERLRRESGDLVLTGAMPGRKTLQAQDEAAELERKVWAEMGMGQNLIDALYRNAPGARRDLVVELEELACTLHDQRVELTFVLPAGGYATQVIREYNDADWMSPRDIRQATQ